VQGDSQKLLPRFLTHNDYTFINETSTYLAIVLFTTRRCLFSKHPENIHVQIRDSLNKQNQSGSHCVLIGDLLPLDTMLQLEDSQLFEWILHLELKNAQLKFCT
jgi:hypothetical protein